MPDPVVTYSRIEHVHRELLSPIEFAHATGMSRAKVFQLIKDGQIQSFKDGRMRRIPRTEVARYIESLKRNNA